MHNGARETVPNLEFTCGEQLDLDVLIVGRILVRRFSDRKCRSIDCAVESILAVLECDGRVTTRRQAD